MSRAIYANILAKTYYHAVTAYRPQADGSEICVCRAAEGALSRSAHTSAPAPAGAEKTLPEASYRLSLFTRPEVWFRLGDRLEITDTAGRVVHGWASDSVCYPSHCVTVVEIREIGLPAQPGGACGDAISCETCPDGEEAGV